MMVCKWLHHTCQLLGCGPALELLCRYGMSFLWVRILIAVKPSGVDWDGAGFAEGVCLSKVRLGVTSVRTCKMKWGCRKLLWGKLSFPSSQPTAFGLSSRTGPVIFTAWYVLEHWLFMGTSASSSEQSSLQPSDVCCHYFFLDLLVLCSYCLWSATASAEEISLGVTAETDSLRSCLTVISQ